MRPERLSHVDGWLALAVVFSTACLPACRTSMTSCLGPRQAASLALHQMWSFRPSEQSCAARYAPRCTLSSHACSSEHVSIIHSQTPRPAQHCSSYAWALLLAPRQRACRCVESGRRTLSSPNATIFSAVSVSRQTSTPASASVQSALCPLGTMSIAAFTSHSSTRGPGPARHMQGTSVPDRAQCSRSIQHVGAS